MKTERQNILRVNFSAACEALNERLPLPVTSAALGSRGLYSGSFEPESRPLNGIITVDPSN
jgi:hypothetical protein